jgi:Flp pilus assembly CpaF family ATPase
MLPAAAARLLRAAVAADLNVVICGRMGAGKTTLLRSLVHEISADDVIVTVETDFELNVAALGNHPYVHAYQARLPSTSDGVGISCEAMMIPALRTRADWIVVGEVRGAESGALVQAMSIGQGAMATVHGGSARDGIERLAELIAFHTGVELRTARWQVYRSVDLVVHVDGDNRRGRRVTEIVAPGVEEDGARFVVHRLFAPAVSGGDAVPTSAPQRPMLERLTHADPDFDVTAWLPQQDDAVAMRVVPGGRRSR